MINKGCKGSLITCVCLFVALFLQGCTATLKSAVGQTTYDVSSYGTGALMEVIRSPRSTRTDALAAAHEIRNRSIANVPEDHIVDVITNSTLRASARSEFIAVLTERSLPQFRDAYRFAALNDPDPDVSAKAGIAYYEWAETPEEQVEFLLAALARPHANMRTRAAIALNNFGPQYLDALLAQLERETSASAAYAICEALSDYRTQEAIDALNNIANDVERVFEADAHLDGDRRIRAEDVRSFAVGALESMVVAPY